MAGGPRACVGIACSGSRVEGKAWDARQARLAPPLLLDVLGAMRAFADSAKQGGRLDRSRGVGDLYRIKRQHSHHQARAGTGLKGGYLLLNVGAPGLAGRPVQVWRGPSKDHALRGGALAGVIVSSSAR